MLESNTEAKQATGTGSKLGVGRGRKGSEGPSCPLGHREGSGILPPPQQERHALESQPASQETRDTGAMGRRRMAKAR